MEWRGVTTTNVYIGNFFFVAGRRPRILNVMRCPLITAAGIGMVISAQWELVLGNTYAYTVLSAFGFFYGGFGAIITPFFGVAASYGTNTAEYNNALGYFVLSKICRAQYHRCLIIDSVGCLEFLFSARLTATVSEVSY